MSQGKCVTWEDDVKGLFTQGDIGCMRSHSLDLSDYDDVKLNADDILYMVKSGKMPKGGRPWSQEMCDTFQQWKSLGFPKTSADCPDQP
ncbi:MAG TPA: hypothetical protein VFV34_14550 [Blastocatellia bacterium]|nr:hypothetical protein [Blastocatellia bacterium]